MVCGYASAGWSGEEEHDGVYHHCLQGGEEVWFVVFFVLQELKIQQYSNTEKKHTCSKRYVTSLRIVERTISSAPSQQPCHILARVKHFARGSGNSDVLQLSLTCEK